MTVDLTPELEAYVRQAIASGAFADEAEVLAEGLRLLRLREERRRRKEEALRRLLRSGDEQLDQGLSTPFTQQLANEIKRAGRERLSADLQEQTAP